MSCDLLPTETPGPHYQGSVLDIIGDGWDLAVFHPPCTYLSYAATAYWNRPGRARKRLDALDFFLTLWEAPIPKICIENPMGCASSAIEQHTQLIDPYFFGDNERKRTCLWLKNLPPLQHYSADSLFEKKTHVPPPAPVYTDKKGKKRYRTDAISGFSKNSGYERSRFYPGIAAAMVDQWLEAERGG